MVYLKLDLGSFFFDILPLSDVLGVKHTKTTSRGHVVDNPGTRDEHNN